MSQIKYLLVDLNSFFASCEQQDQPHLRGKPVAVVPMMADSTSVIASSIQAKHKGVKTGTKVIDAKKLCPGIVFVEGNHRRYTEYHHKIVRAVDEICPVHKVLSIDEMVCELIGRETQIENARLIASKIKNNIETKVGKCLTSSIGLSTNIMLAKLASDMMKPDGLVIIEKDKIGEMIDHLPVEALSGVGRNMQYRLNQRGYYKVGQLRQISSQQMKNLWGSIVGLRLSRELHGEDIEHKVEKSKSLSHQHVLPPNSRNPQSAFEVLLKLTAKAVSRLRYSRQKCRIIGISIRDLKDNRKFEKSVSFQETNDTFFLIDQVKKMTSTLCVTKPIKVSVYLGNLSDAAHEQLSLFTETKLNKLSYVMDLVNQKYGPNSLISAGYLEATDHAKTRVSFNHIPKLTDEFE
ncbi:MAG: DNA polymerase thumb domain-containing protein [Pseudobdellovibrio sp.]